MSYGTMTRVFPPMGKSEQMKSYYRESLSCKEKNGPLSDSPARPLNLCFDEIYSKESIQHPFGALRTISL